MTIKKEMSIRDFEAWAGAIDTLNTIIEHDKCDSLEMLLNEWYPDGLSETQLNDILWFESELLFRMLDINEDGEEDEDWN